MPPHTAFLLIEVPVVHPEWVGGTEEVCGIIGELVRRRMPIHQRYRWRWALVIPLSLPFSLVPGTSI